jgi:signal transduction histidine kinase
MPDELRSNEKIQEQLERRVFYLKTLYDVSREMLGEVQVDRILKNFLLMTTGNFGTVDGFVLIREGSSGKPSHFVSVGFQDGLSRAFRRGGEALLSRCEGDGSADASAARIGALPSSVECCLPFQIDEVSSGLLGLGAKIIGEPYSDEDKDLLLTLVNNLVITLKSARYSEALKKAFEEVSSLNRAKDKVINHLSHEMKTPIAVLSGSLTLLEKRLGDLPEEKWRQNFERAERNLRRLNAIAAEVEDIIGGKFLKPYGMLNALLNACIDQLEVLVEEKTGDGSIGRWLRERIDALFGPRRLEAEKIMIGEFCAEQLDRMRPLFSHRKVQVLLENDTGPFAVIPREPLEKVVQGLVRNGIENTPDGGRVTVSVRNTAGGAMIQVRDTGVGILEDHQKRIFEGFFHTQETGDYRTKHPFDFNAGGKGADLLRMKIFAERYGFDLQMSSTRCRFLPTAPDMCPGEIHQCWRCRSAEECRDSGGTTFEVIFPVTDGKGAGS